MKKKKSEKTADLISLCNERARRIYGDPVPKRVNERIAKEAGLLAELGFADDMYFIAARLDEILPAGTSGLNVGVRDSAASLMTVYLCGLSPFNPMEYMRGRFYPELFFDRMKKRIESGKKPSLVLNVSRQQYDRLKETGIFAKRVMIRNTGNLSLLERLQDETGAVYFPSDGVRSMGDREDDLRKAVYGAGTRGLDFWDMVPLTKSDNIIRALSYSRNINMVSVLAKAVGIAHGTGTWTDNVEKMFRKETVTGTGFDLEREEIISCSEDVYENEHCGGEEFLRNLKRIKYLFGRPECVTAAIEIKRLAYYWNRFPYIYLSALEKTEKEKTGL